MSLPTLPTEIDELVIDFIATFASVQDRRRTLSTCALVCASWHSFTLRHTFQTIRLPKDIIPGPPPSITILHLIEGNPEIRGCIKTLSVNFLNGGPILAFLHDAFEQVCRLCTAVSHLSIHGDDPKMESSHLLRNAVSFLLRSPSLRQLSFLAIFRSSFLIEAATAVQCGPAVVTFNQVKEVVLDHDDSAKFSRLPLRKVKFWGSEILISKMQQTPGLSQLFEHTQHFHFIVFPGTGSARSVTLWNRKLTWGNCTSMDMTFGIIVGEPLLGLSPAVWQISDSDVSFVL